MALTVSDTLSRARMIRTLAQDRMLEAKYSWQLSEYTKIISVTDDYIKELQRMPYYGR